MPALCEQPNFKFRRRFLAWTASQASAAAWQRAMPGTMTLLPSQEHWELFLHACFLRTPQFWPGAAWASAPPAAARAASAATSAAAARPRPPPRAIPAPRAVDPAAPANLGELPPPPV